MLSYDHSYHAGGPADVHKHVALALLLAHLRGKEKPYCVVDLYAGRGETLLAGPAAQKTREFETGILKLWNDSEAMGRASLQDYVAILREFNPGPDLKVYPGSPAIAHAGLRTGDRLIFNELHPAAYRDLRIWAADDRIAVHKRDGLEALGALVPPPIRRGLVLIDPSYEIKDEYVTVPQTVAKALSKWRDGIFLIWYPIFADKRERALVDAFSEFKTPGFLSELTFPSRALRPNSGRAGGEGLRGSGVIVFNPPWQFDTTFGDAGRALATLFSGNSAKHRGARLRLAAEPSA